MLPVVFSSRTAGYDYSVNTNIDAKSLESAIIARLRGEIAASGSNVSKLSRELGMDYETLRRYIKLDRTMPFDVFISICSHLGVSPRKIMGDAEASLAE